MTKPTVDKSFGNRDKLYKVQSFISDTLLQFADVNTTVTGDYIRKGKRLVVLMTKDIHGVESHVCYYSRTCAH